MKIQLNRELLKNTFQSAKNVLRNNGRMMVSLCRGQGGTPADEPKRRWDDSWQITEMAAHGDFILVAVEPFIKKNFPDYRCVGYRGQDVEFNMEGALVHIFSKRRPPYKSIDKETAKKRLALVPLFKGSNVSVPVFYSQLYRENPSKNSKSVVSFFLNLFYEELEKSMGELGKRELKILTDEDIPVYVNYSRGVVCKVTENDTEKELRLRLTSPQIFNQALQLLEKLDLENGLIFFPGMYFNPLSGQDFRTESPISFQYLLLGKNASTFAYRYIHKLTKKFETIDKTVTCSSRPQNLVTNEVPHPIHTVDSLIKEGNLFEGELSSEWVYELWQTEYVVSHVYSLKYKENTIEACVMYIDKLAELFFYAESWKDIWAIGHEVKIEKNLPTLKPALLYPLTYEFDITVKYSMNDGLNEDKLYQVLWLSAGHVIEHVELIDEFHSPQGWSSKTYRITYKSLDKPMYRSRVIDIHSHIVGKMLAASMRVTIS